VVAIIALLSFAYFPGCDVTSQTRKPGCLDQTVVQTDRGNGSFRGSEVVLDNGHSYENLGLQSEVSMTSKGTFPWSIPRGTAVVICPGESAGIFEISVDQIGTQYHQFRLLKKTTAKANSRDHH
jgi:hypothetical protein